MSGADIAVLALVAAALIAAVICLISSRQRGGCGCGCSGCNRSCGKNKSDR